MGRALAMRMKAKNLSDVLVYHKALEAQRAVSAFLKRPAMRTDYNLWDQLSRSSTRVPALIAEGFGQSTDRQSADYYGRARGSAYESYTHLITAKDREYITEDENAREGEKYLEITNADAVDQLPSPIQLAPARAAPRRMRRLR